MNYVVCVADRANYTAGGGTWSNNGRSVMFLNSYTPIANIKDGTSNTMVVSETLVGYTHYMGSSASDNPPSSSYSCPAGATGSTHKRGRTWFDGMNCRDWAYSTLMAPNDTRVECGYSSGNCLNAARSYHAGGVHVLLCDGAVRFVSDSIDGDTWHYLGQKRDGETIGEF